MEVSCRSMANLWRGFGNVLSRSSILLQLLSCWNALDCSRSKLAKEPSFSISRNLQMNPKASVIHRDFVQGNWLKASRRASTLWLYIQLSRRNPSTLQILNNCFFFWQGYSSVNVIHLQSNRLKYLIKYKSSTS